MKKGALLIIKLSVIAAAILISGCKTGKPSTIANIDEDKPVEITVVTSYGGDDGNRQSFENAVKAYESSTGNIVNDKSGISSEEWKAGIISDFQNGTEPDVLFFFSGADANRLIETQAVVSLEEIRSVYPDYASNMEDGLIPVSPYDGKAYAVPVNGFWEGLYVNKAVLADCGAEVPGPNTTWEEFLDICGIIADNGYVPIAASLNEVPHYLFEYTILNNSSVANRLAIPGGANGGVREQWISGLNDIKELYDRGFLPEDTASMSVVDADALMAHGKAAFMLEGSWKMGWFAENAANVNDFTVTYFPGKGERLTTDIVGGISMGYYITKKAWDDPEKQAACVEFVKTMTADEVVATFGVTAVTALKNNVELPSDASNLVKDAYQMARNFTGLVPAVGDIVDSDVRGELFRGINEMAKGNVSAEELIEAGFPQEGE